MIKQNEVAFLKTTGEAVFVRGFRDPSPKVGDKDLIAEVRRPLMGQDGVKHVIEEFSIHELETYEQQKARFLAEREEIVKKYGPSVASPIN